ncbi:phosphate ABC transporter substrate-binding protein PstS [Methylocapsa aurea]|uniref:phosphate ABC transporter substrate-binding protein PstS n=1 Tax=Methylocapsa aurea TaxID=663610 RepID=UPI00055D3C2B|nr:phosphate ABC transporter substrate-binding protein PstS [Methylocapsa aurea]
MITRRIALRDALLASGTALISWAIPGLGLSAEEDVSAHGAGSTFSAPLYQKWIDVYRQDHKQVALSYDVVGSGEGVTRFIAGSVDFGATDVVPSEPMLIGVKRGAISVPATAGMIVLAYNVPGLAGVLRLPRDVYSDIFSGRIKVWNDPQIQKANPNLSLPNRNIAVVVRQDSSGTTAAFTRHLVAIGASWHASGAGEGFVIDWPREAMQGKGNEGVASKIKISEGSIGFVEYGFAKRLGLQMATLENKAGRFVEPSEEAGRAALLATENNSTADPRGDGSYPITTLSWLLLYKKYADPKKAAAVKDWVRWGLTTGQTFASQLGYIPLPAETAALAERSLDAIS